MGGAIIAGAVLLMGAAQADDAPPAVGPFVPAPPTVDFASCKAPALSLPDDLDSAKQAVLAVSTDDGFGSAVLVTPGGMALTAAHVVDGEDTVTVRTISGLELDAEVLWTDTDSDLALLDVAGKGHACRPVAEEPLVTGADVFAIGSPADKALAFSVSKGVTSGYPTVDERPYLQTDASINPGNSGGPLFGADGTVAAVVSWKVAGEQYEGLGFGVPAEVVRDTFGRAYVLGALASELRPGAGGKVPVTFKAEGEGVTIAVARDFSTAATTQYGNMALTQTQLDDLCIAPCEERFKPGVYDFVAYGQDWEPHRIKVDLREGQTATMTARPRKRAVGGLGRGLVGTGFTTAVVGGTLWGVGALINAEGSYTSLDRTGAVTTLLGGIMIGGGYGILGATKPSFDRE